MLIFDAHLDLSLNGMDYGRDLRRSVPDIRALEKGRKDLGGRGAGTVAFPEMRRGQIGLSVATVLAPCRQPENPLFGWHSPEQGWAQIQGQLAWYREMEQAGELVQIRNRSSLREQFGIWKTPTDSRRPLAYVLSLEGADPLVDLSYLEKLVEQGLRAIGPVHYGRGRYGFGTDASGGFPPQGKDLLKEMDRLGLVLDVTHLCDVGVDEALDIFEGPVWASHSNCRALVNHNRQFSEEHLRRLIERGAVIGGVMDAWMMVPGWIRGTTTRESSGVMLSHLIDHIDHICQLAGNADHSGIGSDLDGGFGTEQSPGDVDTIADLQKLPDLFRDRGYSPADIEKILHGNFVRFLETALPEN
ncbi:MAG: dipeptidase [Verrucomicrobiae bacterium]|nr:dipeptidase [Verrucomicrobiae bacterium]